MTLTWLAQQATSCQASGAWGGTQAAQGSIRVAFTTGDVRSFVLACTGAGGAAATLYDAKSFGTAARWLYLNGGKFVYDDTAFPLSIVP